MHQLRHAQHVPVQDIQERFVDQSIEEEDQELAIDVADEQQQCVDLGPESREWFCRALNQSK
jgi:hypothetical protein